MAPESTDLESRTPAQEEGEPEGLGTRCEIEEVGPCRRRIKAVVPPEKVRELLDRNYQELADTVVLRGFRRGRVPRPLLEKRFGEEVESDVKQVLLKESLREVVEGEDLRIFGDATFDNVEFGKDSGLRYELEVDVYPSFDLPPYKGIEVEKVEFPLEESQLEAELEKLRETQAVAEPVAFAEAELKDQVSGQYELYAGGIKVKTCEDVTFVPATRRLQTFQVNDLPERFEAWKQADPERPLVLDVQIPDDFEDEVLRGREARLEFYPAEIRHSRLPELDDAFAGRLGQESLEKLRSQVVQSLEARNRRRAEREIEKRIIARILEQVRIEVPEGQIEKQRHAVAERLRLELAGTGRSEEEIDQEVARAETAAAGDLSREMQEFFLLERIGDEAKILATEDEVAERLHLFAALSGADPAQLRANLAETGHLEQVRLAVRHEKVRAFLRRKARIKAGAETPGAPPPEESIREDPSGADLEEEPEGAAAPETPLPGVESTAQESS